MSLETNYNRITDASRMIARQSFACYSVLLCKTAYGDKMENISRTVRFKPEESELIEEFLTKNPIFDFSSLTRTAILKFIHDPQLVVQPVESAKPKKQPAQKDH